MEERYHRHLCEALPGGRTYHWYLRACTISSGDRTAILFRTITNLFAVTIDSGSTPIQIFRSSPRQAITSIRFVPLQLYCNVHRMWAFLFFQGVAEEASQDDALIKLMEFDCFFKTSQVRAVYFVSNSDFWHTMCFIMFGESVLSSENFLMVRISSIASRTVVMSS